MPAITAPKAVAFARQNARPIAEDALSLYRTAKQFQSLIVERFETFTGGNDNADIVGNGESDTPGIYPVTKENVAQLKFVMEKLVECFETSDRIAVLNRWVVNSSPLY